VALNTIKPTINQKKKQQQKTDMLNNQEMFILTAEN
jgi:hypothetical protein